MDNWLITILALVVLVAVADGVRRAVKRQRDTVRVSRNLSRAMQGSGDPLDNLPEDYDPEEEARRAQIARELPGKVRVSQRRAEDAEQLNRQLYEGAQPGRKKSERAEVATSPSQSAQKADEPSLPEVREMREERGERLEPAPVVPAASAEPSDTGALEAAREQKNTSAPTIAQPAKAPAPQAAQAAPQQASLNLEDQVPTLMESLVSDSSRCEPSLDESASAELLKDLPDTSRSVGAVSEAAAVPEVRVKGRKVSSKIAGPTPEPEQKPPVEEVLIINIVAREGDCFEGNDLLRVLLAAGLRFGTMKIFHYHRDGLDDGPIEFSLANMVKPGVFDLGQMEDFTTPGLSLFLTLPIEGEAIKALQAMLSVARQVAEQLGGELKDEHRSVFTAQTAEHYRQRVAEFQRRKALARAQA